MAGNIRRPVISMPNTDRRWILPVANVSHRSRATLLVDGVAACRSLEKAQLECLIGVDRRPS